MVKLSAALLGSVLFSSLATAQIDPIDAINRLPAEQKQIVLCAKQRCYRQYQACDDSCIDVLQTCFDQCQKGFQCWLRCFVTNNNERTNAIGLCAYQSQCLDALIDPAIEPLGTPGTVKQLSDLPSQYMKVVQCSVQRCAPELQKCTLDANCLTGLKDCFNTCQTRKVCWVACLADAKSVAAIKQGVCSFAKGCLNEYL